MSKTKYHRQLEEQRKRDLQVLSQLSRDVDASLRGPQKVKLVIPPMYVPEYTKSQGDSEYASNIRAFGAKQLQRAFGANKGALNVQQEVQIELQRAFGRGTALKPYVDLCTQVIMHEIIQGAVNFDSSANDAEEIKNAKDKLVAETIKDDGGLIVALDALNADSSNPLFEKNVYAWLYPISRSHISAVEAEAKGIIEQRDAYLAFLANADAQSAVLSYLLKEAPSAEVLLPAAINGTTPDLVKDALAAYPEKDLVTTYNYYRRAVDASYDTESGIRTGDVDASLRAAREALSEARTGLRLTGIDSDTTSIFAKAFSEVEGSLHDVNAKSSNAKDKILVASLDLVDVLGMVNDFGAPAGAWADSSGFGLTNPFAADLLALAKLAPSKYLRMLDDDNIEYLDAREMIRPKDVSVESRTKPNLAKVQNAIGLAFLSLQDAYSELSSFMAFAPTSLSAVAAREVKVTDAFKTIVKDGLKGVLQRINTAATTGSLNDDMMKAGVDEALMQLLALPKPSVGTSYLDAPFEAAGNAISEEMFNRLADGTVSKLGDRSTSGGSILDAVENAISRKERTVARTVSVNVRRTTRDAALRAAKQIEIALEGVRIQALNTGVQVRQNPSDRFHTMAVVGMGAGVLVGDHAVTALLNRGMMPKEGSMKAHLVDTLPSVATAAVGAYMSFGKNSSEKHKQVGHALIGGALAHIAARYIAKVPSLRFSESGALKYTLQAIANAPANMLGDLSMGPSALTPADAQKEKGHLGEFVCNIVRTNSYEALCYIGVQLWKSGLTVTVDPSTKKITLNAEAAPKDSLADALKKSDAQISNIATLLCMLKCGEGTGHLTVKCSADTITNEKCDMVKLQEAMKSHAKTCGAKICEIAGVATKDVPYCDTLTCCGSVVMGFCGEASGSADGTSNAEAVAASINKLMSDTVLTAEEATALVEAVIADTGIDQAKRDALAAKKDEVIAALQVKGSDGHLDKAKLAPLTACVVTVTETSDPSVSVSTNPPAALGGFILEPGYQDMRVYSGEDHVSYLQPRPYETAQAGYVQLDEAIARARQLTPYEKHQEGLGDLQGMPVVRLNPHDAKRAEMHGCGVCMGRSRVVPNTEVFAVEGANGEWPIHQTPQYSVPQGDLNYPRIGEAQSLDVSPTGLFTRGVFQPSYGRK